MNDQNTLFISQANCNGKFFSQIENKNNNKEKISLLLRIQNDIRQK